MKENVLPKDSKLNDDSLILTCCERNFLFRNTKCTVYMISRSYYSYL